MGRFRVLIAGGGVAALEAALALQHVAEDRVSVALIAPEPRFWYRPLAVAEPFGVGQLHGIDLAQLADECGALFVVDALASVDADARLARTVQGAELEYDALLVATGARPVTAVPGAITFRGPADVEVFSKLLSSLRGGAPARVVFAVPGGVAWPLPLYELALQTAGFLETDGVTDVALALVTPEESPLALFGSRASAAVAELLEQRRIEFHTGTYEDLSADAVVALPRLAGLPIEGLPSDAAGFIPTDANGRVQGLDDVFAAGDATSFPIKQGGLAAQQADAAAETIAAAAGTPIEPEPFRPVLRGLLLTGEAPTFLRAELGGGTGDTSIATSELLWWPPGKIVGRYLAPFLAERAGAILAPPAGAEALSVDVELTSGATAAKLSR
jgi:sulfide:quinone oxidoreductase